jgi:hypothetical protein
VTRWLFIYLAVALAWFSTAGNARAHTRAGWARHDAGGPGAEVDLVAGITLDTFQGNNEDPLTLHECVYANANPVGGIDPSGHDDLTLGSLLTASAIGATIGGFSSAVASVAEGRAITAASIFQGAALGAVLGPIAYASPAIGLALGVGGVVYSGLTFGPILLDPAATTQQKVASSALIIASIYGCKAGFDYAKAANSGAIPRICPDPECVTLEHGTTLASASKIFVNGPDENFIRPGETTPANGFSTSIVSPNTPIGSASQYAAGKALVAPNEGGPAVLRIAVPKSICDKAIKVGNEVRFERGHGLEELQAAWKTSVWRAAPKQ